MTRGTIRDLSIGRYTVPTWEGSVLCQVDARYAPSILAGIEARKTPFALPEGEDRITAYDGWCVQQVEVLMSIGDRIISEVRALREGVNTPPEAIDPALDPYTLNLTSLRELAVGQDNAIGAINTLSVDVSNKLDEVVAAIQASGGSQEDITAALDTIIFLLGAL